MIILFTRSLPFDFECHLCGLDAQQVQAESRVLTEVTAKDLRAVQSGLEMVRRIE